MIPSRSRQKFVDGLYVGLLVLYVLSGMRLAPFHGDESTIIYMSRDWFRSPSEMAYGVYPPGSGEAMNQELRLLNGVLSKDSFGLAFSVMGIGVDQINTPWDWSTDWWTNRYYGHIPAENLLFVARLTSTLMTALSVAVVFTIGCWLARRPSAWLAAFVYTMMPVVLLNGRRAMFEGATLLTSALVILLGLWIIRRESTLWRWALFGLICGLGIAAKHTTALLIVPVSGMALLTHRNALNRALVGATCAGLVTGGVFLLLNPAWWSAPLRMPGIVLSMRQDLLARQASAYPSQSALERLTALIRYPFGPPQYFEDAKYDWTQWIGGDIAAYEASKTAGLWGGPAVPIEGLLAGAGMAYAVWRSWQRRDSQMVLFLAVMLFLAVTVYAFNAVPWARYYMPLAIPFALACGLALAWLQTRRPQLRSARPPIDTA